ncbi:IPTL-CTERM sorting domain-containing protein [Acidovorax facilis]|uniref:IPTL-CTERM sorting domain-containing protein n=1 Tax=Acidovorax facilis TaxID=12917 RepID=UPI003CEAFA6E
MYLSPPGEQNTTRAGATVEPFSGATGAIGASGNFAVGAWSGATSNVSRNAANQFGGAGGTGTFLSIANANQVSITLTGDRKYVGFWWSAGNAGNSIDFYDDADNLLAAFTTTSLTALLGGGGNITAINGNEYAKSAYFGNPNPPAARNTGEPYGYINLLLQGTTVNFRRIVIRHAGGGSFELDNLAVTDSATVPSTWVNFGTTPVTLPPGAIGSTNDTASTPRDVPVSGNVATNDTTVPGSTFVVTTPPPNGSVTLDPSTGAYTYTPNSGFVGDDTFTYQQCKPAPDQAECATATVTVTVAPDAVDDTEATAMNTPLNASVATNDFILTGSTFTTVTPPANGGVVLNPNGTYTYTPNPGYTGTDTFVYRLCLPAPNAALCDDATVTITIAPQAVPVASSVSITGTPSIGQTLTGNYTYTDVNADLEGISTFRWVRSPTNSAAGGVNVGNASTYTTVPEDDGNNLFFCVTPVAVTGLSPGVEVCSPASRVSAVAPSSIPTLSQWGMIILSLLMGSFTLVFARARR